MKHLGDITKISGYTAPIVDCIIGGSPCQGLSQAGLRKGLADERSGLYIDQVRIVKEMRERDERNGRTGVDIRPRYMVWENVYGALSSGTPKGEDFRIVLEELAKIADKDAVIPMPPKGKWTSCGCIMGDGWSIAWRILDAQFLGTPRKPLPQRRRRISLIADFGGQSAPEILFVRESLSGDIEPGREKRQGTPAYAEGGPVADHRKGSGFDGYNGDLTGDVSATLGVNCGLSTGRNGVIYPAYTMQDREGCAGGGKGALIQTDRSAALRCQNAQVLFQPVTFSKSKRAQSDTDYETWQESDTANTLNAFDTGDVRTTEAVVIPIHDQATRFSGKRDGKEDGKGNGLGIGQAGDPMNTLTSGDRHAVVYALDRASYNQGKNAQFDFEVSDNGVNSPLVAKGPGAVCYGINGDKAGTLDSSYYKGCGMRQGVEREVVAVPAKTRYIVRRLTPLECERLQGFPDGWTLIGEPKEVNVPDYIEKFDETKFVPPNPEDFGLSSEDVESFGQMYDDDNLDDDLYEEMDDDYAAYLSAYEKARSKATKKIKVGSHKEVRYYYTDVNGKKHQTSDAARYKALGNSIALPPWKWVLKRLCACYERDATMASLFDGIGGFPYLWEQLNGKGTCLWASEIEDFPIAVTKVRIGE